MCYDIYMLDYRALNSIIIFGFHLTLAHKLFIWVQD